MKAIKLLAGAAALVLSATPAVAADFSGFRLGANVGYADEGDEDAITYAANIGYDFQTGGAVIGITGEVGDSNETGRDFALSGRVGGVVGSSTLIYGHGGYTNLNAGGFNFEGIRAGAGVEFAVSDNAYVNAEYRYSNYDSGLDFHGAVVGGGFRF